MPFEIKGQTFYFFISFEHSGMLPFMLFSIQGGCYIRQKLVSRSFQYAYLVIFDHLVPISSQKKKNTIYSKSVAVKYEN
jgi:hypothetical protein